MTIEGAIAELQNLIKADDVLFYYNGAIQKVIETIIDECKPTKGRWIADKWENIWKMEVNCYRCSNCGIRAIDHSLIMSIVGLNYCPNCGAKMERRADEHV